MNIDDILEKEEFKSLRDYLDKEIHSIAGEELYSQMLNVFNNNEKISRNWYFSKLLALGNKRPYDFCKDGKKEEIKQLLGRIEWGEFS
jgi:hypothetical protein